MEGYLKYVNMLAIDSEIATFVSAWGVMCRPEYNEDISKWLLPIGWEEELTARGIEFEITKLMELEPHINDNFESRKNIIEQLTQAAEASGLSVPFESFYYKYRNEILYWVNNGGNALIEIFSNDTSEWLDMRETEQSLSPREYALGLLMPTTEKDILKEMLVDETDVVEASVWNRVKSWFGF